MRSRLRAMDVPPGALLCTFHSLCVRMLREFADRAGLPAGFSIYDQSDQKAVLADVLQGREARPQGLSARPGSCARSASSRTT